MKPSMQKEQRLKEAPFRNEKEKVKSREEARAYLGLR